MISVTLSKQDLKDLAYHYTYDGYGRMIEKQLPGVKPVYMVYDGRDRLVAVQDGEMRSTVGGKTPKWLYTRYDALNRPVETGFVTKSGTRDDMVAQVNAAFSASQYDTPDGGKYTMNSFPRTTDGTLDTLTFTFYDSYDNGGVANLGGTKVYDQTVASNVTGLPTVSRVKELKSNTWSTTATYYDEKGRVIQTVKTKLYDDVNGSITVSSKLNFVGQPEEVKEVQNFNGAPNTLLRTYNYYDSGQLKEVTAQLNTNPVETLATYTYNELGQVKKKQYGGTSQNAQKQDYEYNIRGWLTKINDPNITTDYFAMKLGYETPDIKDFSKGIVEQYGGNISSVVWRTAQVGNVDSKPKKGYGFAYDGLDRLKGSSYAADNASGVFTASKAYAEKSILYDNNGNIKKLVRSIANEDSTTLAYEYSGNQLLKVNSSGQYLYDDNGNATTDGRNGFTIAYNEMNLPKSVSKGGQAVTYTYDATGAKLAVTNPDGTARYYYGSMVYDKNKRLVYALHDEGMVLGSGVYQYNLKDHLGNTRAMFSKNAGLGQPTALAQATDYYPFGKSFDNVNVPQNRYLYNGKEMQDQSIGGTTFGWYDYGARFYDPELGVWHSMDPKAEVSRRWSTYTYCYNNPLRFIDPDGMLTTDFLDKNDELVKHVDDGSNAVFKQTGKGVDLHYELNGFDEKQKGVNQVTDKVVESSIQEQQNLNMENPSLQQYANGANDKDTHCNQATQNILKTVGSALGDQSVVVKGSANEMVTKLNKGENSNFEKVNQKTAETNAANGGLSLVGTIEPGHGHILSYSAGENIAKGKVANIGSKKYTGFTSLNGAINKVKSKSYFILKNDK